MSAEFDIVSSPISPGLSVIEASAGTGKTYAISHLVPRLILDGTVPDIGSILLVTFTNDAARELSDRVRRVLEQLAAPARAGEEKSAPGVHHLRCAYPGAEHSAKIRQALLDIDRLAVSTIHSFCQRTIQMEGTLCGLPVMPELLASSDELVERELMSLWEREIAPNPSASAVAGAFGWSLEGDLKFLRLSLSAPDADPLPPPGDFAGRLSRLEQAPERFSADLCQGLSELLESAGNGSSEAGGSGLARDCLLCLGRSKRLHDPGFLEALKDVKGAPEWVSARTGAGRKLRAGVAAHPLVALANEVLEQVDELAWSWKSLCAARLRKLVPALLKNDRAITYDGLIQTIHDALGSPNRTQLAGRLRARYLVGLIDESQDTDARQYTIFRNLFVGFDGEAPLRTHRLVLIGDPKQAIYGFRGADVNTYLAAKAQAEGNVYRLNRTYRSPEPLVSAVNAFFLREGSLLKDGLEFVPALSGLEGDALLEVGGSPCESRIEAWVVPDEQAGDFSNKPARLGRISGMVATEVVRILSAGSRIVSAGPDRMAAESRDVRPRDFAVLVSNHEEAEAVAEALRDRGVPAIQARGDDIMATEEAAGLLTVLRALEDPGRARLRRAALATRLLGGSDASLRAGDDPDGEGEVEKFIRWQALLQSRGVAAALAAIDREEGVCLRLASGFDGERRITNFRQLSDLLQKSLQELGNRTDRLILWLARQVSRAGTRSGEDDRQLQLESDAEAVQIVTMHAAKGLEYSLVFCPFLWSSRAPDDGAAIVGSRVVNLRLAGDPSLREQAVREALEDRLRLTYVALTRARVRVWLMAGAVTGAKAPPSALDWLLRTGDGIEEFFSSAASPGRGFRHQAGLEELAGLAGKESWISTAPPPRISPVKWSGSGTPASGGLRALDPPTLAPVWGVTSFSALTRESHAYGGDGDSPPAPASRRAPLNPFALAPGGAAVGTAIHEWIQNWDFSGPSESGVRSHFTRWLPDVPQISDAVTPMLVALRDSVLPGSGCRMSEACGDPSASEWNFHLPIRGALSAVRLAEVFAAHSGYESYAARLRLLPAADLRGFLQGFIDRLTFHRGAWGVVDWKTNRLDGDDYQTDSLLRCAMEKHYLLQTVLYLVALRRHLGGSAPVSGAWLVFLRGVEAGGSGGILSIQPPVSLLDDLEKLFEMPASS